jgi:phosphoribosylformylglycinamidine cyclo-ligase
MTDAYASAGVDTGQADQGVAALVDVLRAIDPGRSKLALPSLGGHYASVLRLPGLHDAQGREAGIALATDSVGSKVIIAEQTGRFDTIGIDCVAMNVNDLVCVGAEPLALLDYIAVEQADPGLLAELAVGLRTGAEQAGVEIPGGEVCQIPEVLRGHPSPYGFDLVGSAFGLVALDQVIDGSAVRPGHAVIGLPASGVHSNGLTLARRALLEDGDLALDARPPELGGASVADALLTPTVIYVRAAMALIRSSVEVHGLAHITGGGLMNLLRIGKGVGYEITATLPVPPVYDLIAKLGSVSVAEMWEVFNMGCGFVVMVPEPQAPATVELLSQFHPGTAVIGSVTDRDGVVDVPALQIRGDRGSGKLVASD